MRGNQPVKVPVQLGLDDDNYSEIVHGDVKEGDLVVTSEQPVTGDHAAPRAPHF